MQPASMPLTEGSKKLLSILKADDHGDRAKKAPAVYMRECVGVTFQVINYANVHPIFRRGHQGSIEMTIQSDSPRINFQAAYLKNPESVLVFSLHQEQSNSTTQFKATVFVKRSTLIEKIDFNATICNENLVSTETNISNYRLVQHLEEPINRIELSKEDILQGIATVYSIRNVNYLCIIKDSANSSSILNHKVYFRDTEGNWYLYKQVPSKRPDDSNYYFENGSKYVDRGRICLSPCFIFPDSNEEHPVRPESILDDEGDDERLELLLGIAIVDSPRKDEGNKKKKKKEGCILS